MKIGYFWSVDFGMWLPSAGMPESTTWSDYCPDPERPSTDNVWGKLDPDAMKLLQNLFDATIREAEARKQRDAEQD